MNPIICSETWVSLAYRYKKGVYLTYSERRRYDQAPKPKPNKLSEHTVFLYLGAKVVKFPFFVIKVCPLNRKAMGFFSENLAYINEVVPTPKLVGAWE